MAEFNWADLAAAAKEAGFGGVIPKDTYHVKVVKAEVGKTAGADGKSVKQKITVQFKVMSGPHANTVLFNDFVVSPENPKALGYFFKDMVTLGFSDDYFATNPPLTRLAAEMVDREVMAVVGIRVWNEQEKNNIDRIRPMNGAANAPQLPRLSQAPQIPPMAPPITHAQPLVPPAVVPQYSEPQCSEPEYPSPDQGDTAPPVMPAF